MCCWKITKNQDEKETIGSDDTASNSKRTTVLMLLIVKDKGVQQFVRGMASVMEGDDAIGS